MIKGKGKQYNEEQKKVMSDKEDNGLSSEFILLSLFLKRKKVKLRGVKADYWTRKG